MSWNPDKMLEIKLRDDESFLKIKETLTRIGIPSKDQTTLYQSCHILHKRAKYYIVHFKEMFEIDEKYSTISIDDIARRNSIARLLQQWNLLTIVNEDMAQKTDKLTGIKVLPHKDKNAWKLESKYTIGNKKK